MEFIFLVVIVLIIIDNFLRAKKELRKKQSLRQDQEERPETGFVYSLAKLFLEISTARALKKESPLLIKAINRQKYGTRAAFLPKTDLAKPKLERRKKYLQIALNSTMGDAKKIIRQLPSLERILIEAGTPFIKNYGIEVISEIKDYVLAIHSQAPYIVADIKSADLAQREVEMAAKAGASAATCLGVSPVATIDTFIKECKAAGINSMIDMMNVEDPLLILKKLEAPPDVVMLHRGVDETEVNIEKVIPYYRINQIKGNYDILTAVAGGDNIKDIQSALFNGADIIVLWKAFYNAEGDMGRTVKEFLKAIR